MERAPDRAPDYDAEERCVPARGGRPVVLGQFGVLGTLALVSGVALLLENFGLLGPVHKLWPIFPLVFGVGLVLLFFERGRTDAILLGLGSYLVGLALLFFVLNYTRWDALSWAWPVFIGLVGVSSVVVAPFSPRMRSAALASGSFLILLAIVFFMVFKVSPRLWPISLILFGAWTLVLIGARRNSLRGQKGGKPWGRTESVS